MDGSVEELSSEQEINNTIINEENVKNYLFMKYSLSYCELIYCSSLFE